MHVMNCAHGFSPLDTQTMPAGYPFCFRDLARLPEIHPAVHDAFMEGKFVAQRGDKKFSLVAPGVALDQSQEQ